MLQGHSLLFWKGKECIPSLVKVRENHFRINDWTWYELTYQQTILNNNRLDESIYSIRCFKHSIKMLKKFDHKVDRWKSMNELVLKRSLNLYMLYMDCKNNLNSN